MKLGKFELSVPQAIVMASVVLALGGVYTFGAEETQAQLTEWLGYAWGGVATLLGPLVRRRIASKMEES